MRSAGNAASAAVGAAYGEEAYSRARVLPRHAASCFSGMRRAHCGRCCGAHCGRNGASLLQFANHAVGQMRGNGFFGFEIRVAGSELEHALERHAGMLGDDLGSYIANAH